MCGMFQLTRKMCRWKRWKSAPKPLTVADNNFVEVIDCVQVDMRFFVMRLITISVSVLLAVSVASWACSRASTVASAPSSGTEAPGQISGDLHYKVPDGWVAG